MSNKTGESPELDRIRSDVYAELFEMLRLPYSEAESVNDRAKRTTEHVIKHCMVEIMMRLIDSYTMAYETPKRYMHDHRHVEVMPGQMMPFDAGDQPIHKALTRPIAQHVDSFPKIPMAPQELTPQILHKIIEAHLLILHTALLEANQIAGEAMDYACDNDAVQKIYAKTYDALKAYNELKGKKDL